MQVCRVCRRKEKLRRTVVSQIICMSTSLPLHTPSAISGRSAGMQGVQEDEKVQQNHCFHKTSLTHFVTRSSGSIWIEKLYAL